MALMLSTGPCHVGSGLKLALRREGPRHLRCRSSAAHRRESRGGHRACSTPGPLRSPCRARAAAGASTAARRASAAHAGCAAHGTPAGRRPRGSSAAQRSALMTTCGSSARTAARPSWMHDASARRRCRGASGRELTSRGASTDRASTWTARSATSSALGACPWTSVSTRAPHGPAPPTPTRRTWARRARNRAAACSRCRGAAPRRREASR
mmetsp:Transcript_14818/g.44657  ORF Transcript_14818/g.44657 Transcript_14818/m.44657 type:complete len:211 (-) Transcript_14818:863-1495(-)